MKHLSKEEAKAEFETRLNAAEDEDKFCPYCLNASAVEDYEGSMVYMCPNDMCLFEESATEKP